MKLGSRLTHPKHGPVEVAGLTAAMVTYRVLETNERRYERRPGYGKWRVGGRCWIVPDDEEPDIVCRGVIVSLNANRQPKAVLIDDRDPVWHGCEIETEGLSYGRVE